MKDDVVVGAAFGKGREVFAGLVRNALVFAGEGGGVMVSLE